MLFRALSFKLQVSKTIFDMMTFQMLSIRAARLNWTSWRMKYSHGLHASSAYLQQNTKVAVTDDKRGLKLSCEGEKERKFYGKWLRHNCRCPACTSVHTGQTIVNPKDLHKDLEIAHVGIEGDMVNVEWSVSGNKVHSGHFSLDWLKNNDYSNNTTSSKPLIAESLPICTYEEVMESDEGVYKWLLQINQYGVSLLKNMPTEKENLVKLINRVGYLLPTTYGETIDVKPSETPTRQAFSTTSLLLHMDQGFYECPPGVQFLHCLKFDKCVKGGESVIVDAYPVVEEMRRKYPKQFDTLTKVSVPVIRHHYTDKRSIDFIYEKKIIVLNDEGQIVGINWYPHLQGPLRIKDENLLEKFYEGFTLLAKMFDESKFKLVHRLQPGEALTFHNRRALHSRNGFQLNRGMRHLHSAYLLLDDFKNKLLTLRTNLGKTDDTLSPMLNGSSFLMNKH